MGRVTPWGDNGGGGGGDTLGKGDDNGGRCDTLGEGVGSTPKGVTAEGWAGGGGGGGAKAVLGQWGRLAESVCRKRGNVGTQTNGAGGLLASPRGWVG